MTDAPASTADDDEELVRRARQGSFDAFEVLVSRHERYIYTLALRIVRSVHDAEEVVQESFLSALEHLTGFAGASSFRTWLVRIATNHALKLLRRRRAHPAFSLDASSPDDDGPLPHPDFIAPWRDRPESMAERHETRRLLAEALDALEEKYRLVFLLRDVEGLSTGEASHALNISEANVKVRLLRARLMLRERLTRALGDAQRQVRPDPLHQHQPGPSPHTS
jgi:RNA polymerase sigma-70 factor (ECF subfamily)